MTRIALVGIGKIALDQHVPAIAASPTGSLPPPSAGRGRAGRPGLHRLRPLPRGAARRAGGVALHAARPAHAYAEAALKAGRHVMLEKPPGATVAEVQALAALAAERGVTLFATWHSRMARAVEPARQGLARGAHRDARPHHLARGRAALASRAGLGVRARRARRLRSRHQRPVDPDHILPARPPDRGRRSNSPRTATPPSPRGSPSRAGSAPISTGARPARRPGTSRWRPSAGPRPAHGRQRARDRRRGGRGRGVDHGRIPRALRPDGRLVADGTSDVDLAPLVHVADAMLLGRRITTDPFHF
jgi:D-galactose 1-dehydrogenase